MTQPLKAQFWIRRTNGLNVPLFAADELPYQYKVEGNPRSLAPESINESVIRVPGEYEPRHQVYQISDTTKSAPESLNTTNSFQSPQPSSPLSNATAGTDSTLQPVDTMFPFRKKFFGIEEHPPSRIASSDYIFNNKDDIEVLPQRVFAKVEPLPPWQKTPDSISSSRSKGKKVYCSHWMSTGECNYAQQGCLYRHEMPLDVTLLNSLGFQDIPKWYREKHGLGKLTAVPGSGAHIRGPSTPKSQWRSGLNRGLRGLPPAPPGRSMTGPQLARRRPDGAKICGPRPFRRTSLNLLDLDSTPATPAAAPKLGSGNSLLNSKFAPLPMSQQSHSISSTFTGEMSSARSSSDTDQSSKSVVAETDSPPNTSVETLDGSVSTQKVRQLARNVVALHPRHRISSRQGTEHSVYQRPALSESRRSSIATDYETELTKELADQDAKEAAVYAMSKARFVAQREQEELDKARQEGLMKAQDLEVVNGPRVSGEGQNAKTQSGRKGRKKIGPSGARNRPKKHEGAASEVTDVAGRSASGSAA